MVLDDDVIVQMLPIVVRDDQKVRGMQPLRQFLPESIHPLHVRRIFAVELIRRERLHVRIRLHRAPVRRRTGFGESHELLRRIHRRRHRGGAGFSGRTPLFRLPTRAVKDVGNRARG